MVTIHTDAYIHAMFIRILMGQYSGLLCWGFSGHLILHEIFLIYFQSWQKSSWLSHCIFSVCMICVMYLFRSFIFGSFSLFNEVDVFLRALEYGLRPQTFSEVVKLRYDLVFEIGMTLQHSKESLFIFTYSTPFIIHLFHSF